jgi:hypothetical protein
LDRQNIGSVRLEWVSPLLRRADLYIHEVDGAVSPEPVQDGSSTAYFDTVFADSGWDLTVHRGESNVPCRRARAASDRWTNADLFELLRAARGTVADVDTQWRVDLLVVPTGMDAELGVMFDEQNRTATATFCNGRYSPINSLNYGEAAGQRQLDVPRAYLRSALHEVTHAFNQIDQHRGSGDDNSIMTTTPRLADVLRDKGETFPTNIRLGHNMAVRSYLNHLPDPVVRPCGWPFQSWCWESVPRSGNASLGAG